MEPVKVETSEGQALLSDEGLTPISPPGAEQGQPQQDGAVLVAPEAPVPPVEPPPEVAPPSPKAYTEEEYKAALEVAAEEGRRQGQAAKDKEIATVRQQVAEEAKSQRAVEEARAYLERTRTEDPEEFARLLTQPEIANFWGGLAGQEIQSARGAIEQEVTGEVSARVLTKHVQDTTKAMLGLPEFGGWTLDRFRAEGLYPDASKEDFYAWVGRVLDYATEHRSTTKAKSEAEVIAKAQVRDKLAALNVTEPDLVPVSGSPAGALTPAVYAERLRSGKLPSPEEVDAMTRKYLPGA